MLKRLGVTIVVLAFVALAVTLVVKGGQLAELRRRDARELAERQSRVLVDAGWLHGLEGSAAELAARVPALEHELAAAKAAGATVAIAQHWQGTGAGIAVPWPAAPAEGAPPATGAAAELPAASVLTVPHVKIDEAVAIDAAGGIYVARAVSARLTVGTSWASAWEPIVPDDAAPAAVDPELAKAWNLYRNPPPRPAWAFRLGVGAPGPVMAFGATWAPWRHLGAWAHLEAPMARGGGFVTSVGLELRP